MTADRLGTIDRLRELIGKYWGLAYAEGKEGRDTDTPGGDAARTWSAIEACLAALTPAAGGAVGVVVEGFSDAFGGSVHVAKWEGQAPAIGTKLYTAAPAPPPAATVVAGAYWDRMMDAPMLGRDLTADRYDPLYRLSAPPPADAVRALVVKWRATANEPMFPAEDERDYLEGENRGLRCCADELEAALTAAAPTPEGEVRLWDSQWVNVVNHANAYDGWETENAVAHAVKMTERLIAENVATGKLPPAKAPQESGPLRLLRARLLAGQSVLFQAPLLSGGLPAGAAP